jgi:hypothetical protein
VSDASTGPVTICPSCAAATPRGAERCHACGQRFLPATPDPTQDWWSPTPSPVASGGPRPPTLPPDSSPSTPPSPSEPRWAPPAYGPPGTWAPPSNEPAGASAPPAYGPDSSGQPGPGPWAPPPYEGGQPGPWVPPAYGPDSSGQPGPGPWAPPPYEGGQPGPWAPRAGQPGQWQTAPGYGPGSQWGPGPPPWPGPPQPRIDRVAIAALVLGIVSLLTFFLLLPAVIAVVLALIGYRRTRRPNSGKAGGAVAVVGGVLGVLSILAGGLLLTILLQSHILSGTPTSYTGLASGDCYNPPVGLIRVFHRVSCSGNHEGEVTGSFQDSAPQGAPYPGSNLLTADVIVGCQRETMGYIGAPLDPSRYSVHFYGPSRFQWNGDERTIVCTVRSADGSKLRGSIRGI